MTIKITGKTSFLEQLLAEELRKKGFQVIIEATANLSDWFEEFLEKDRDTNDWFEDRINDFANGSDSPPVLEVDSVVFNPGKKELVVSLTYNYELNGSEERTKQKFTVVADNAVIQNKAQFHNFLKTAAFKTVS